MLSISFFQNAIQHLCVFVFPLRETKHVYNWSALAISNHHSKYYLEITEAFYIPSDSRV